MSKADRLRDKDPCLLAGFLRLQELVSMLEAVEHVSINNNNAPGSWFCILANFEGMIVGWEAFELISLSTDAWEVLFNMV